MKDIFLHRVTRSEAHKLPNIFSFKLGALTVFVDNNLEEGMATHSSIVAWRIPWTEEPGGL